MTTDQASPRWCFYIPVDQFDENGWIPSRVVEGRRGHDPLKGNGAFAAPWYWGKTYKAAKATCEQENLRIGVTPEAALEIILSSIAAKDAPPTLSQRLQATCRLQCIIVSPAGQSVTEIFHDLPGGSMTSTAGVNGFVMPGSLAGMQAAHDKVYHSAEGA